MDMFVFCFNHCGTATESFSESFIKIRFYLAEIFRIYKCFFFVYGFACFFVLVSMGYPEEVSLIVLWRPDLIWLTYLWSKKLYLFVSLFFLFMDLFVSCIYHCGTPTESFPGSFVKTWLDLADIFRINNCLFVVLF